MEQLILNGKHRGDAPGGFLDPQELMEIYLLEIVIQKLENGEIVFFQTE